MDTFQLWKLAADAALVLSIIYLCVRFIRNQAPSVNARELRDLEIVLKNLLKDADVASRSLSETLGRRQQSLERLLSDLAASENRISTTLNEAERHRGHINRSSAPVRATREVPSELLQTAQELQRSQLVVSESWAEPPSFDTRTSGPVMPTRGQSRPPSVEVEGEEEILDERPRRTGAAAYQSQGRVAQPTSGSRSGTQYNIYGEPVAESEISTAPAESPARAPRTPRQPLVQEIEVERIEAPTPRPQKQQRPQPEAPKVQEVYEAAERLLQAGQDMDAVAAATRLPLDEVRKLSQIMIRATKARSSQVEETSVQSPQQEAKSDPTTDPRLGVFANIRRQTQVL